MAKPVTGKGPHDATPIHRLESLETRKMLTTIYGGEVIQFTDMPRPGRNSPQLIRVETHGDIIAELIGFRDNRPGFEIGDLDVEIIESANGRGGFNLDNGLLIGPTDINDPIAGGSANVEPNTDNPLIDIRALAADSTGQTYALNVLGEGAGRALQLLTVDTVTGNTTVVADLTASFPTDTPFSLRAAAIDPTDDNTMFFVGEVLDPEDVPQDILYQVDLTTFTVLSAAAGTFLDGTEDNNRVESLVFDQDSTDPSGRRLLALVSQVDTDR